MTPPVDPPTHITLRLKVPPGHIDGDPDSFVLPSPVPVDTTLGQVRDLIHTSLPTNPEPARQRLLYFGRALVDNDQTLASALNITREPSQTEYIVHLVVKAPEYVAPAGRAATPPPEPFPNEDEQRLLREMVDWPGRLPETRLPETREELERQRRVEFLRRRLTTSVRQVPVRQPFHGPLGAAGIPQLPLPDAPPQLPLPNVAFQQAQLNAPPLPGQPRTHNLFVQGVGPYGARFAVHDQQRIFQHPVPNPLHPAPAVREDPAEAFNSGLALGRVREQIADLNRLLQEHRAEYQAEHVTPEQNAHIARIVRMQEQARNVHDYIQSTVPHSTLNRRHAGNTYYIPPPSQHATYRVGMARSIRVPPPENPENVTCYLLSDSTGSPQALLMKPQHGTFTGTLNNSANVHANHATPAMQPQPQPQPAGLDQARVVQARRAPWNGDAVAINPVGLFLRHFWLLMRIMIFSYFLLGSNMGWRRPLALGAIALGFWLMRAGMLGDGGVIRGWWEDIVREGAAAVEPARPAGAMPTPEEVARRLMEERRRGENEWARWGRERVRAVVLLLASLWPGVGEAFVRAREAEERRLAELEVAEARRREEEAARVAAEEVVNNESESTDAAGAGGEQAEVKSQAVSEGTAASAGEATPTGQQVSDAEQSRGPELSDASSS